MLQVILIVIVVIQVCALIPLSYSLGKKTGEHREYARARKEIQKILENV